MISGHLSDAIQNFSTWLLPMIFAITLHEAAHGYAALRLGDDTAQRMGRISINPFRHIDPFGTVILPSLLLLMGAPPFGWAKPVPVNFNRLKPIRVGMAVVGAAGPATNIVLALVSALLMYGLVFLPEAGEGWAYLNLRNSVQINLILAVFNMIPIPPLDGGRVAVGLLPLRYAMILQRAERYTLPGLMIAMFILPYLGLNVFGWIVGVPVAYLIDLISLGTGIPSQLLLG
jgi:Zn-dependent protease